jgi:hypothetical protein
VAAVRREAAIEAVVDEAAREAALTRPRPRVVLHHRALEGIRSRQLHPMASLERTNEATRLLLTHLCRMVGSTMFSRTSFLA